MKSFFQNMGCSYEDWVNIIRNFISSYYSLIFFIAYTFIGHVHVFAGLVKIVSHKCNIEIFLSPDK